MYDVILSTVCFLEWSLHKMIHAEKNTFKNNLVNHTQQTEILLCVKRQILEWRYSNGPVVLMSKTLRSDNISCKIALHEIFFPAITAFALKRSGFKTKKILLKRSERLFYKEFGLSGNSFDFNNFKPIAHKIIALSIVYLRWWVEWGGGGGYNL